VGPEFANTICQWDEDRLNNDYVSDTQSGASPARRPGDRPARPEQRRHLDPPHRRQLVDVSATTGGLGGGEMLYVSGVSTRRVWRP